jgi:hypothetical protein
MTTALDHRRAGLIGAATIVAVFSEMMAGQQPPAQTTSPAR